MISLVLADDHAVVLAGVRMLVEAEPDFSVVAEAVDGAEALRHVFEKSPDVLVIDLMMPCMTGLEVARRLQDAQSRTRVVFLSMHVSEAYVVEALRAGAVGYVVKEATGPELVAAIRAAAEDRHYLSSPLSSARLRAYLAKASGDSEEPGGLTPRERQVLQLAAQGHSNSRIAGLLGVSRRTVETHRASIRAKLDLHDTQDLLKYALRTGLATLD